MATSPEEPLFAYLVLVRVSFIGGKETVAIDAFRAEDESTALNYARNLFIQSDGGAVVYGTCSFFVGTIAGVEAEIIGVLDEENPSNAGWIQSMDSFEAFLDAQEQKEQIHRQTRELR